MTIIARPTTKPMTDRIADLLDQHPRLTYHGFGVECPLEQRRNWSTYLSLMCRARVQLMTSESQETITKMVRWIEDWIEPRKTINERAHSYFLKHVTEKTFGRYCSNGQFICAALLAGYDYHEQGVNAMFNMRSPSLQRAIQDANRQENTKTKMYLYWKDMP